MYTFTFNADKQAMERACAEFENRQELASNELCKAWRFWLVWGYIRHNIHITHYTDGDFRYIAENGDGYFICRFDGNKITITEGKYMGRACRAASTLKKFAQSAMRVYSLYKCGYID